MNAEQAAALRAPFPPEMIGKIPKAGTQLDYVGHAAVTDRLLSVDPEWDWEPFSLTNMGAPFIETRGNDSVMWIHLTIHGVTRPGVGIVATKSFELEKQLISDAIRNAAMRFGVALDLWSKEDLHSPAVDAGERPAAANGGDGSPAAPPTSKLRRENLKARCLALQADHVSVADKRAEWQLPTIDKSDDRQLGLWEEMLTDIEKSLTAPFVEVPA